MIQCIWRFRSFIPTNFGWNTVCSQTVYELDNLSSFAIPPAHLAAKHRYSTALLVVALLQCKQMDL